MLISRLGNNLAPSSKRAVGMALLISVGNLGGVAGSNIFLSSQAPTYPAGFGTGLGITVTAIGMAAVLRRAFHHENEQRRLLIEREGAAAVRAKYTEQELMELGDKSPFFVYTL